MVRNEKPVTDIEVGLAGENRRAGVFAGYWSIGTDENGRFAFYSIPAATRYYFYGKMASLQEKGAIPVQLLETKKNGATIDLGQIELTQGHRVAGKVVLSDGKPVLDGIRLMLGHEQAWDTIQQELNKDGTFEFSHVIPGEVSLHLRIPGYRLSAKNESIERYSGRSLAGTVDRDIDDLTILMEPGSGWDSRELQAEGQDTQPYEQPLRGTTR